MRNTILFFSILIASILVLSYCKHEPTGLDQLPEVCFEKQVLPIFQANCTMSGCHNGTGESFDFRAYEGILQAVNPGNPTTSEAYKATTNKWGEMMPPKGNNPLTAEQRTLIYVWIEQGALETTCSIDTTDTIDTLPQPIDSICFEQKILPILLSSCAISGCHNQTSAMGDIVLNSYSTLMGASEEPLVVKGNANASKIMEVVKDAGEDKMPPAPKSPLTSQQIAWLTTWINEGALNSSCDFGCDTLNITYAKTIWPLIQTNCLGCHSGGAPSGGVNLSTYANVHTTVTNNLLLGVVEHKSGYPLMPPSGKLSDCNIRQIQLWIEAGAQNNK